MKRVMMPSPVNTSAEITSQEAAVSEHDWLAQACPEVELWVDTQNAQAESFLGGLAETRGFRDAVRSIVDAPFRSAPMVSGNKSLDLRRQPGEEQASLWVSDDAGERCVVSAAEFDDISDTITDFSPSPDGLTVAWALSHGGADWKIAKFRSTITGKESADSIQGIKWPNFAWIDNNTVAYHCFDRPPAGEELTAANSGSCVRVHTIGTDQSTDETLFQPASVTWALPTVSADRKWLAVQETVGTVPARIHRQPAATAHSGGWETVIDGAGPDTLIDIYRDDTLVLSHAKSPLGQIVSHSSDGSARVVYEARDTVIEQAHLVGDYILLVSNTVSDSALDVIDLAGAQVATLEVPPHAQVEEVTVDSESSNIFVAFQLVGGPRRITQYRIEGRTVAVENVAADSQAGQAADALDNAADEWDVSIVEAVSADGTAVPMRVVRAKGSVPNRTAKVLLSVYGGYGVHYLSSSYDSWHRAWLEAGGVLAYAGVRGGSERGETWHESGIRDDKQRGIDDLLACIEWFEISGWSAPKSVAVNGMSNGGLMVSTVLTQRPDLLGAAIPEVAVVDMLRFHLYTAAHGWIREFGDPDVPRERAILAAYSPLHNISRDAEYPPTLILTADKDDRVPPGPHSYKLAAELQSTVRGRERTFLRVSRDAGHAVGRSSTEKVAERSAVLAFAAHAVGLSRPERGSLPSAAQ